MQLYDYKNEPSQTKMYSVLSVSQCLPESHWQIDASRGRQWCYREYYYGKMGEVLKTVRTLIVPNQAVATYVTLQKYDSHNRLWEMIYPDEEKVTYGYNLGGQVDHVRGYKAYFNT